MTADDFLRTFPLPVIGVDAEDRVVLWNAAAERLLGWQAEEVNGHRDPSVPPGAVAEREAIAAAARRRTRSGALIDVQITNAAGPGMALTILHPMSGPMAEEERAPERESELRLMLEQLPAVLSTYDCNLVFTSTEGAGLSALGLVPGNLVGQRLVDVVGDENAAAVVSLRAALRGEASTNDYEYRGRIYENHAAPLRDRAGAIVGAMNLGFDVTERRRAESELHESREQLRLLSAAMNRIQEEERRRMAREVHDEMGQLLTSLRLDLEMLRDALRSSGDMEGVARIDGMFQLVDETLRTVRRVAGELRPALLDEFGLRAAVEQEVASFAQRTGVEVRVSIVHDDLIDSERASAVYRIMQEGLTNVARHAGATLVELRIEARGGRVEAELRDNGRGITPAEINSATALGLLGVRERAYALGGQALIEPIPGDGTRVFVSIPQ